MFVIVCIHRGHFEYLRLLNQADWISGKIMKMFFIFFTVQTIFKTFNASQK